MLNLNTNWVSDAIKTLQQWWPVLKSNFQAIQTAFNNHLSGAGERHNAQSIDYTGNMPGSNIKSALDNHIGAVAGSRHNAQDISYSGIAAGNNVKTAIDSVQGEIYNLSFGGTDHDPLVMGALIDQEGTDFGPDGEATYLNGRLLKWEQKTLSHLSDYPIDVKQPPAGLNAAIGGGIVDDYIALQSILNFAGAYKKSVYLPSDIFLIGTPLTIPDGVKVYGEGTGTIIRKTSTTSITINSTAINSVLVLQGSKITIEDITFEGSIPNNVNGITFGTNASRFTLNRLNLRDLKRAFHDFITCYIGEFNKIHCIRCEEAFVLKENFSKTTLTFRNCWAENCGQAYDFNRMVYSSLINCAADYCNYITGNPYGDGGHGSQAEVRGIYNFNLCRSVSIIDCGAENSYGNGVVKIKASVIKINGLEFVNIKSEFRPDYGLYPNYGVGPINIEYERSTVHLLGCYFSEFENTYVKANNPTKPQPAIAYNYLSGTYGANTKKMVIATALSIPSGLAVFGGQGPYADDCLFVDEIPNILSIKDYIDVGGVRQFKAIDLTGSSATKLRIPITSQNTSNRVHLLRIRGFDNTSNNNTPKGFICEVQFSSLTNVANVSVLLSSPGVTAAANGTNLEITLGNTYNNVKVECKAISQNMALIGFLSSTLV